MDLPSSWDFTRQRSLYHFDNDRMDPRWDTVIGLGRFEGEWQQDLDQVIRSATPSTWETVRHWRVKTSTGPISDIRNTQLEENDISRAGGDPDLVLTNMEHEIPPVFRAMIDEIGLENSYNRIHVQWTGQVFNRHIDKLHRYCPEDPSRVMRIFVMLTDWEPGHFYQYGNYMYQGWRAGDIHTFDWANVPHCTANAGLSPRVSLVTTGVRGPKTDEFLAEQKKISVKHIAKST